MGKLFDAQTLWPKRASDEGKRVIAPKGQCTHQRLASGRPFFMCAGWHYIEGRLFHIPMFDRVRQMELTTPTSFG